MLLYQIDINGLVLVIGLTLLITVVILSYREIRVRNSKKREADTRLLIGSFDLYNPGDRGKLTALVNDLYRLYLESHAVCHKPVTDNLHAFERFTCDFAHPYLTGRIDLSTWDADVAAVFREKHAQLLTPF